MKKRVLLAFTLVCMSFISMAQMTVTGTVKDSYGESLPSATITIKGTTEGVVADIDGKYSIKVPNGETILTFQFVGLEKKEVKVGTQTVINVILESSAMEELVFVGYADVTDTRISGSIGKVDGDKIGTIPMASFDQVIQGRTPGLLVQGGSGQPGSAAKVRIRGNGSISSSNTPLYVVDGIPIEPGAFASLNPNDFATINVLKDASATALYGSRGANGVLVITTKRGTAGKTTVNYRYQTGWSQQARDRFEMMNSAEKIDYEFLIQRGPVYSAFTRGELTQAEVDAMKEMNTDWRDVFIRTGRTNSHELNFSGGSDKTNFYASVNYFSQEGQALRSGLDRYTMRLNVTSAISDKLLVGINSSLGYSEQVRIESENAVALANPFAAVYLANPYEELFDPETGEIASGAGLTGANAYDRIVGSTNDLNEIKSLVGGFVEVTPIDGLQIKSQISIDYRERDSERFIDPNSFTGGNVTPGNSGLLTNGLTKRVQWTNTNTISYNKVIADRHDVSITAGTEALQRTFNSFNFTGYGLNPQLPLSNAAITTSASLIPVVGGSWNRNSLFSVFSVLDYTLDDKYNFRASLRRDGSSRFGAESRYATFWSVAGSWNMDRENFMRNAGAISRMKLRASYGTAGNQELSPNENAGNFNSLTPYVSASYAGGVGTSPGGIGDPALKWEVSKQFNAGVDAGLWDDRLTATVDFYNNITDDLFITKQLSRTTGFGTIQANAGKMRNRGVELSLNYDIVRKKDFSISVGGNVTYNSNIILDLGKESEFVQGTSIIREGLPLGSQYAVEWVGVNPANGQPLYRDLEGNVTTTFSADFSQATFGTSEAPWFGGFNTEVTWKGFSFTTFWTYMADFSLYNNQRFFQENPNFVGFNLSRVMLDMWKEPGDVTDIQSFVYNRQFSSKDIEDASFLRLRNVMFSYNLPKALTERTHGIIQGARIYVQGQNLLTFTKFTGFDPEDNNNIAQYEYPASKIITLGLDVTF